MLSLINTPVFIVRQPPWNAHLSRLILCMAMPFWALHPPRRRVFWRPCGAHHVPCWMGNLRGMIQQLRKKPIALFKFQLRYDNKTLARRGSMEFWVMFNQLLVVVIVCIFLVGTVDILQDNVSGALYITMHGLAQAWPNQVTFSATDLIQRLFVWVTCAQPPAPHNDELQSHVLYAVPHRFSSRPHRVTYTICSVILLQ